MSGRDKEGDVIACCAEVMRGCSVVVDITNEDKEVVCDIVGTGGDGQNTFNVSTTSGLVAAGAGCRVYKVSPSAPRSVLSYMADAMMPQTAWQQGCYLFLRIGGHSALPQLPYSLPAPSFITNSRSNLSILIPVRAAVSSSNVARRSRSESTRIPNHLQPPRSSDQSVST